MRRKSWPPATAFASASSAWAIAAIKCFLTLFWSTRIAKSPTSATSINPISISAAKKIGNAIRVSSTDYRQLLGRNDIDAVVIINPAGPLALLYKRSMHRQARTDVYIEKPLSLCVNEIPGDGGGGDGETRHAGWPASDNSSPICREAAEFIPQGRHQRKFPAVRAFHIQNGPWPRGISGSSQRECPQRTSTGTPGAAPASRRPYNKNRAFYRFRWFYDYSGGQLTNMGVHYIDLIHWAANSQNAPLAVAALGGKFAITDNREVPDTMEVMWHYRTTDVGHVPASSTPRRRGSSIPIARSNSAARKGTLFLLSNGPEVVPDSITPNETRGPHAARSPRRLSPYHTEVEATEFRHAAQGIRPELACTPAIFLDCVTQPAPAMQLRHRSRPPRRRQRYDRQHRTHKTRSLLEWDAKTLSRSPTSRKRIGSCRLRYQTPPKIADVAFLAPLTLSPANRYDGTSIRLVREVRFARYLL